MTRAGALEAVYPLSPLQKGILFHSIYTPGSELYLRQLSTTFEGELDPEALRRAWQGAVDRHPILRTAFVWEGVEQPVQAVLPQVEVAWREEDWSGSPASQQARRLDELLLAERRSPFQLTRPPLMRLVLVRLARDRHQLVWTFHQMILDGWSKAILLRDVTALYQGQRRKQPVTLLPTRPFASTSPGCSARTRRRRKGSGAGSSATSRPPRRRREATEATATASWPRNTGWRAAGSPAT
jgi:hypothetical protein